MNAVVGVVLFVVIFVGVNVAIRFVFGLVRRSRLDAWLAEQRLHTLDARVTYRAWGHTWAVPFRIRVRDPGGRESEGTLWTTGRVLHKVWVDWD